LARPIRARISLFPSSYYLSANFGATKTHGIQINAEGVTLDLNGFEISRASGARGNGVEIPATAHRASVRNGSLKGFNSGIRSLLATEYARGCGFRDLSVSGCSGFGISAGSGAVLESCRAHDNSAFFAIYADKGSLLTNCSARGNTGSYGIYAGEGSSLANCSASNNASTYGIFADHGSSLTNCSASRNTGTYGILTGNGSSLANCSAHFNTGTVAESAGISTGAGATVTGCTAYDNDTAAVSTPTTGMGFKVGVFSTIQHCTASNNKGDGINVISQCLVRDNHCVGDVGGSGGGIHTTGTENRIEGNNVAFANVGIQVDTNNNLIIKNSVTDTFPSYQIAAGNRYGPIIDIAAGGTAAVNGNSAPSVLTSTDPWANFTY
jgi:hypothetical protein